MDLDEAVAVIERHKALPEEERRAAKADPNSDYTKARVRADRFLAAMEDIEQAEVRAKAARIEEARRASYAQQVREERKRYLARDLESTVVVLASVDASGLLRAIDVSGIAKLDRSIAVQLGDLGITEPITPPSYSSAIDAWQCGEPSNLAEPRRLQRDALLAAVG